MDFVKQWSLTICITLIISVIFSILSPKGNMGKFFKIILATFIFISFIYPLKSSSLDFDFPMISEFEFEEQQQESYEQLVEGQISQTLEAGGYSACIIECEVEYSNDEIIIEDLTVSIPKSYIADEVKAYIMDNLGMVAEVYYIGE